MSAVAQSREPALWSPGTRAFLFYGGSLLLLSIMMAKLLGSFLPAGVAAQVGHNSESVLYAALVCATVQLVRDRPRTAAVWGAVAAFSAFCIGMAVALKESSLPSSIATLNEPLVAVGLTALYVTIPRPVRWPLAWSAAILLFTVVLFNTTLVLDQAESLVPLMLAPICLDVVDRSLLDPEQPNRPGRRWAWCACLVAMAVLAMLLARAVRPDLSGPVDLGIDYAQRAAEAYWGWLLIHLYLGFWLPWSFTAGDGGGAHRALPDAG